MGKNKEVELKVRKEKVPQAHLKELQEVDRLIDLPHYKHQ